MENYDFEEERIKQEIIKLEAKRVLLQMPQGLKSAASKITKIVEKAGALPIISADPCYGGCDVATFEAEMMDADLIIHFGHSKLLKHEKVPTLYIEARATVNIDPALLSSIQLLSGYNKIGLVTTVQHVQTLDTARELLTRAGKTIIIGDSGKVNYPGQVIGCNYSNVKSISSEVEAFLFIGGGKFHALGVALAAAKPTIVADPYAQTAYEIQSEIQKIIKQQYASIEEAQRAKTFGVLVSLKPGQKRLAEALKIKATLEKMGKTAYLLAVREVLPEILNDFPTIDAFVNTACPRISLDDASKFNKPVITINEFLVVSGESTWKEILKEGLFEK
ncbi:MAG: diphthamide biosynthesis enzyme Dph2 [Crenarchaeota archaeon]|nr:diphthamide biosynthesis enzyme Dph2 [Thermoproteota archaeon]